MEKIVKSIYKEISLVKEKINAMEQKASSNKEIADENIMLTLSDKLPKLYQTLGKYFKNKNLNINITIINEITQIGNGNNIKIGNNDKILNQICDNVTTGSHPKVSQDKNE